MIFLAQDNFASGRSWFSHSLTYGWWIMQVPQTLLGTSIATAILPALSELFSGERFDGLKEKIERARRWFWHGDHPCCHCGGCGFDPAIKPFSD